MYIDRKQMACCMWQSREGRYGKHRDKSFGSDRHIHYFDYGDSFTVYMYVTTYHLYTFSSGHVWMWELDCEEGWAPKNWCFWTLVLEKTLESPLYSKEIKPVNPKGNQPWIFIGGTDCEAEAPILQIPGAKSQLIGKDPDAGKVWRWEEKGRTDDEMVGWHHRLNGHESE